MRFRITSYSNVESNGINLLYVDVEFLADLTDMVLHKNDFIMQLQKTITQYIGPPLTEEEIPNPVDYETVNNPNLKQDIIDNITRYIDRIPIDKMGDDRKPGVVVTNTDPEGIQAIKEISDMIGVIQTKP